MVSSGTGITLEKLAFSFLPQGKAEFLRFLEARCVSVDEFFRSDRRELEERLMSEKRLLLPERAILEKALTRARQEQLFMERHNIKGYFFGDDNYPWRLLDIPDAPVMLYVLGDYDFDSEHIMSIVGTRRCTPYGLSQTKKIVSELGGYFPDLGVVSGLAYGIDAAAHTAALECGIPTIAVVAHGLDTIYPASHRDLAKRIVQSGGAIVTEYPSETTPFRKNFLERNRIVAALSEITVVIESALRGGALSTANSAFSYSREVFALPGRAGDEQSEGCNNLIRKGKAALITSSRDIMDITGWHPLVQGARVVQHSLFPEMNDEERRILDLLNQSPEAISVDMIHTRLGIPVKDVMATLGEMEFNGYIIKHPGNRYSPA